MSMMNDFLSQEEIDALLKGTMNMSSSDDDILSDIEKDALGEIGNISMGTAATTLSTLLYQRVNITTPKVDIVTIDDMAKQYSLPFVAVQVNYKEGLTGTNLLILKEEDVKIITSLMMGGDGVTNLPSELDDIHLSAISEAMNQMVGSSSTSISEMISKKIDISPPNVFKYNLGDENIELEYIKRNEKIVRVSFEMKIGNLIDSNIMQLLPIDFAKNLVNNMLYGESSTSVSNLVEENNQYNNLSSSLSEDISIDLDKSFEAKQQKPQSNINVQPVKFESFDTPSTQSSSIPENISLIKDVFLKVTVELGRTKKSIDEILQFAPGTVIELDKLVGEPLDILVNGKKIAKGEVVVIDENYGIRITDIIKPEKRLRSI
ncbi:flagellar motor switch protein FliN/FliY [Alkalithermobacter thermoalcaliphilus JW-YL-7 = DSM 7308]|uniref:CheC, phosphatase, inhibitor of MCP methylation / FliN fusion protein n=3 Tax=Clostridium paradoxum TaxID=29346 RepID=A0A150FQC4_CLOPD|nr:CheC, phosphatase, inhibitor of MCP methylation / FliN fusion protein [[Clostridium] paradoxum JW-YL-7 = DSM 7308]SHK60947.1 flagellar motor switch protein FliN/FliY [[Clostridium] paradoxum JW-YL-7 = DSM 7308]